MGVGVALACGPHSYGATDVRCAVARFLAALPLGCTQADAEVESSVGNALTAALLARMDLQQQLSDARRARADLQHKLSAWCMPRC